MATVTSTPTSSSISISGTTAKTGTISWTLPTVPNDATITSCVLSGIPNLKMTKGSASIKVNSTTVTNGIQFQINLGTNNKTSSVTVTATGNNRNSTGTLTFSGLKYEVTYTEPVKGTYNLYVGSSNINKIYLGNQAITKVYLGDVVIHEVA